MKAIKRDYKKEYAEYGSKLKAKKYRAELNQINRESQREGKTKKGDGKDASHVGSKIKVWIEQAINRAKNRPKKRNSV
tara:strand:- start:255 stop:488 length:234 start_codon:yes stop_codon:yes gene_type:complete